MKRSTRIVAPLAALLCALGSHRPAESQARGAPTQSYIDWDRINRWHAANQQWWNSLTPRQQGLERAISAVIRAHTARTGEYYVAVTPENVGTMMRVIGATQAEEGWVTSRMRSHAVTGQGKQRVDEFLQMVRRDPRWYLPPTCGALSDRPRRGARACAHGPFRPRAGAPAGGGRTWRVSGR
ncbi:MAG TPA: hypothetical protein VF647_02645 [Longimicrobium sp.]|jgi:hypothetical protein